MPARRAARRPRPVVYLIHFESPYRHARHYIGWTQDLRARLACHQQGRGARLMAAVSAAGIPWRVARKWEGGTRAFERKLHNRKGTPLLCPHCDGARAYQRAEYVS